MSVSSTNSAPSISPIPLISIQNPKQKTSGLLKITEMSIFNSQKVVVVVNPLIGYKKPITVVPSGFEGALIQDENTLKQYSWEVKQEGSKFTVVATPIREKENSPLKLTRDEERLLTKYVKFPPEKHTDQKAREYALREACNLDLLKDTIQIQIDILQVLLLKLKIQPDQYAANRLLRSEIKTINLGALEVFFQAGLKFNQIDLQIIISRNIFNLYQKVLDNKPDLTQVSFTYFPKSPFFYEVDKEERYQCYRFPFFQSIILETSTESQFFSYFKKTQPVNKEMIDQRTPFDRTLLMCMLNNPETYAERLEWLLQFNPAMNALDSQGRTALFYLLMSVDPSIFEKYLDLLIQHGLNLNQAISEKDTQFSQCLNLLVDSDVKNKDMQILNFEQKSDLLQKITSLIRRGADCSKISLETFLSLPSSLQAIIDEAASSNSRLSISLETSSESADTSSGSPPKTNVLSSLAPKLNAFWTQFSVSFPGMNLDFFKSILERAVRKSNMSLAFSENNIAWHKSLFDYLNEKIGNAIRNGVHTSPSFEAEITTILNQWKGAQQKDISEKQAAIQASLASTKKEAEIDEKARVAKREQEKAQQDKNKAIAEQKIADIKNQQWHSHLNYVRAVDI